MTATSSCRLSTHVAHLPPGRTTKILEEIQKILWFDAEKNQWDPELQWDASTIEKVAAVLTEADLDPKLFAKSKLRKRVPFNINPKDIVPTKFSTVDEKIKGIKAVVKFVEAGCPQKMWTPALYYVFMKLGFIAHYDIHGFWHERWSTLAARLETIRQMVCVPVVGQAEHTWSDVGYYMRKHMQDTGILDWYRQGAP